MDEQRIAEIRARADAATLGPWLHIRRQRVWSTAGLKHLKDSPTLADSVSIEDQVVTEWVHGQIKDRVAIFGIGISWCFETPYAISVDKDDAEFVAHARQDVPELLDALTAERARAERAERAEAEVARLREALREVHDHVVSLDWDATNGKWHYVERELPKLLAIVKPFAALADPPAAETSCQIPPKV